MIGADTDTIPADDQAAPPSTKRWLILGGTLLAAGAIAWLFWPAPALSIPESIPRAEYDQAVDDYVRLIGRQPTPADALMMLADSAARKNRYDLALDCYEAIPTDHHRHGAGARIQEARTFLRLDEVDRAEASLRKIPELANAAGTTKSEDVRTARQLLVFILAVELRFEERQAVLAQLIADGQFDVLDAKQYYFPSLLDWKSASARNRLREFLRQDPTNSRLLTAEARQLVGEGKTESADRLLASLRQHNPNDRMVIAASLECCYEQNNWSDFDDILSNAPDFSDDEPWLMTQMRAEFAVQQQDWESGETYFRKVLSADPSNVTCYMGLAKVLSRMGRDEERKLAQNRSLTLARIRVILPSADREPGAVRAVAEAAGTLQMNEAASAFNRLADRMSRRVR